MLKATRLAKKLGQWWVLNDITLEVKAGEMLGIIGPNGSGKSTLLRLLSGEEKPDQGEVLFLEKPLHEYSLQERAKQLAVLTQEQVSDLSFTAEEIVMMGRHPYHRSFFGPTPEDERIVCRVMDETETRDMKLHRFNELSGGERQRVSIARVMAQEPKLLMLDEPTTYLDIHYQLAVLDRLKAWQKESFLTVIIVLHDLNLAAQYCDSLLVLKEGRQVRNGTIRQVIEPRLVEEVYGIRPVIVNHPILHIPQVLLTSNC
ncbi:heme ABC transporter ATP-binding protein [Thermoactinomyces mirandus]|uniref:Heme ABC transporter ATP-binding protein n=1 Tax=Thermoactinomyces mirandus TaxID=2756294 RepID=A0A7W1XTN7_9BACL|nr:heme ABC transporter ATP-binding protein [Thermoactinomyces mirandus]MBA4603030.1 heme ABC transporter ATP-binding protein [Thermoactinomyces mirandus]